MFTQFDNDGQGHYEELEHKNIDTGMGLERLGVVVQDVDSLFTVDTNLALLQKVCQMAGKEYKKNHEDDISLRIVTDHIKSCTFMISDGIMPSNEGRGYVLRRLLRRAARHGRKLGIEGKFLAALSSTVIELSKGGYPELDEKKAMIHKVLTEEEDKFNKAIDLGLAILGEMEKEMEAAGETTLSGENAFKLYDTYGFPLDLTKEILEEKNLKVDEEGFSASMKEQKTKAREARKTTNYMGADVTVYQSIDPAITTEFTGYDKLEGQTRILALTTEDEVVEALRQTPGVRQVNYSNSAAEGLSSFNAIIGILSLVIIGVLLAVSVFLISNTINVAASFRKNENEIMRYIGATNYMIRAPFVVEGLVIGLMGAILPLIGTYFFVPAGCGLSGS